MARVSWSFGAAWRAKASGGPLRRASIFVAVLGVSNYTYAEATESQELENWIGSHIRTFEFLGGLPKLVIPDNTRSGVNRACRYEPDLNRTYHEMAMHYGVSVLPARPYKPRDKAKVETGVQVVERWIVAADDSHSARRHPERQGRTHSRRPTHGAQD